MTSGLNQDGMTRVDVDLPVVNPRRSYSNLNLISPQIENIIEPNNFEAMHFVTWLIAFLI